MSNVVEVLKSTYPVPLYFILTLLWSNFVTVLISIIEKKKYLMVSAKLSASYKDLDLKDADLKKVKAEIEHANTLLLAYKNKGVVNVPV